MPSHFDAELNAFKEKLLLMGSQAENAVSRAVKSVLERQDALALQVKEEDDLLDHAEVSVDDTAIHLLAKAPLASDLRLISVGMKISHDLERVGDEATTIARRALELNGEPPLQTYPAIVRMVETALVMLKEALDAFVHRDPAKARQVVPRDKQVDELNRQLHCEFVACMMQSPDTINRCLSWMRVAKSLERIADHATNIAEEVVYLYEGRDIRHADKTALDQPPQETA